MRYFIEYVVIPFSIIVAVLVAVLLVTVGVPEVIGRYQCSSYERITGTATKYNTLDTCYVQTDAGWQRWDEYKARIIASEGLSQ